MEQVEKIGFSETAVKAKVEAKQDLFDNIDRFMEEKLFRFLIIAVPVYFGAHIFLCILISAASR